MPVENQYLNEAAHYGLALSDACSGYAALRPPNRVTISRGAHDNLIIRPTGGAGGPWSPTETPYMPEPMNALASRQHEAVVFVGPARTGKCLDLDTEIPTPDGWTTMRALRAGDTVFSDTGLPTKVLQAHAVKYDLPCFEVRMADGSTLVADSEHLWGVERYYDNAPHWRYEVLKTAELLSDFQKSIPSRIRNSGAVNVAEHRICTTAQTRQIVEITPVPTRPVRCIEVDAPSHLFLAGRGMVPTHNTAGLLLGWMAHNVVNDPGDMLFIQMSQVKAREFSKTDVDRALRHSEKLQAMLTGRREDSNTFDTMFRHGMWLRIAWPTVGNVSGSTYRYVAITDIDRMENAENVDGEGPLFDLAKKRTTTFLSRGMTLVESSPGFPLLDPSWRAATPHEAPPTGGILNLYNRSDRHRWYWKCPDCRARFEAAPGLGLFNLPPEQQLLEEVRSADIPALAAHHSHVVCPHCGSMIAPKWKTDLNKGGIWVPDNVTVDEDDNFHGTPMNSKIRGYWLGGVAAAYQSWTSLLEQQLYGLRDYALTGSEEKLKNTTNVDQGAPYMSRRLSEAQGTGASPLDRAQDGILRHVVPDWTRTITAAVDVQGGVRARFIVQVHAVGPFQERQLVDRFEITESKRPGMGAEFAPIDPAKYVEDWDLLTERVLLATWRTPTAGHEMRARMTVVDTGGEDGVTRAAYAWFRKIRREKLAHSVALYKGGTEVKAPLMRETRVGKRGSKDPGDIPLMMCNPNLLKDMVFAGVHRATPGPSYYHFPKPKHPTKNPDGWLPAAFYEELESETRNTNGSYTQVKKRNETLDLCCMNLVAELRLGLDKITDWTTVPAWLAPLGQNSEIVLAEDRRAAKENVIPQPEAAEPVRIIRPQARKRRSAVAAL